MRRREVAWDPTRFHLANSQPLNEKIWSYFTVLHVGQGETGSVWDLRSLLEVGIIWEFRRLLKTLLSHCYQYTKDSRSLSWNCADVPTWSIGVEVAWGLIHSGAFRASREQQVAEIRAKQEGQCRFRSQVKNFVNDSRNSKGGDQSHLPTCGRDCSLANPDHLRHQAIALDPSSAAQKQSEFTWSRVSRSGQGPGGGRFIEGRTDVGAEKSRV